MCLGGLMQCVSTLAQAVYSSARLSLLSMHALRCEQAAQGCNLNMNCPDALLARSSVTLAAEAHLQMVPITNLSRAAAL